MHGLPVVAGPSARTVLGLRLFVVVVILTTGCYLREEHRDTAASANELANEIIVGRQWKATRDSEWVDPYATPDIKQFGDSAEESGVQFGPQFVSALTTATEVGGVDGYTTYELSLVAKVDDVRNVYTVFGDTDHPMQMPPAFQVAPFGANVGGCDPLFFAVNGDAKYDSWMTVGLKWGNQKNEITTLGVAFDEWDLTTRLEVSNGALFWLRPDSGPELSREPTESVLVAQLTLRSGENYKATLSAQGRTFMQGKDWGQNAIQFKMIGRSG